MQPVHASKNSNPLTLGMCTTGAGSQRSTRCLCWLHWRHSWPCEHTLRLSANSSRHPVSAQGELCLCLDGSLTQVLLHCSCIQCMQRTAMWLSQTSWLPCRLTQGARPGIGCEQQLGSQTFTSAQPVCDPVRFVTCSAVCQIK